jgi:hypothetical protein
LDGKGELVMDFFEKLKCGQPKVYAEKTLAGLILEYRLEFFQLSCSHDEILLEMDKRINEITEQKYEEMKRFLQEELENQPEEEDWEEDGDIEVIDNFDDMNPQKEIWAEDTKNQIDDPVLAELENQITKVQHDLRETAKILDLLDDKYFELYGGDYVEFETF